MSRPLRLQFEALWSFVTGQGTRPSAGDVVENLNALIRRSPAVREVILQEMQYLAREANVEIQKEVQRRCQRVAGTYVGQPEPAAVARALRALQMWEGGKKFTEIAEYFGGVSRTRATQLVRRGQRFQAGGWSLDEKLNARAPGKRLQ